MKLAVVFFVVATVSAILIGLGFARTRIRSLALFGGGFVAVGAAFALWTIARIADPADPDDLEIVVTIGVLLLFVGLISFFLAWAIGLEATIQRPVLLGGLVYLIALVVLRFVYPSEPFINDDGVLFFNPHGAVAAMEIGAVTGALLPAIFVVCRQLREREALVAKVALTTLLVSGIALIASLDETLITIASVAMVAVFLLLLAVFVVRPPGTWLGDGGETARTG